MRAEPLSGPALRVLALSLAWELSDLAARSQIHGAVDPDHVVCHSDGLGHLVGGPIAAQPSRDIDWTAPSADVAGWGRTVAYAATGALPALGSQPALPDVGLARIVATTIALDPSERPDATELELRLADLEEPAAPDWGPTPVDAANFFAAFALFAAMRREEQALRLPWLRGHVPSDLLDVHELGSVVRAFRSLLRFWGTLAFASLVLGASLLVPGLLAGNPVLWSPGVVLAVVGAALLPWLLSSRGMAAVIFEHGFAVKRRGRRWTGRWEHVTRLQVDVRRRPTSPYASVQISAILADGERFHVPRAAFGRRTLVLAAILDRRTYPHRLAKAQDELEQGARDFGTVRLTPSGIEHRKAAIAWPDLASAARVPHNVRGEATTAIQVRGRGTRGEAVTLTIPEYRTWDARVLAALLEDRIRAGLRR